ncbi:MAG: hypothetical protein ACREBV_00255, partial [Candidatus Zixiibacteriota bacterium]
IIALYQTDLSVSRRVQFYVFIFMLPGFLHILYAKFGIESKRILKWGLVITASLSMLYSVFYRNEIVPGNPRPVETTELVNFIKTIPNHANTRFFVTEFDNHQLVREVRYRSFLLRGNPIYFRQDKFQADSVFEAYNRIIECGPGAKQALREFDTRYAIIGKSSFNISPIKSKITENELSVKMIAYFNEHGNIVFDNKQWIVIKITNEE